MGKGNLLDNVILCNVSVLLPLHPERPIKSLKLAIRVAFEATNTTQQAIDVINDIEQAFEVLDTYHWSLGWSLGPGLKWTLRDFKSHIQTLPGGDRDIACDLLDKIIENHL